MSTKTKIPATITKIKIPTTIGKTKIPATISETKIPTTISETKIPATISETKIPATINKTKIPATISKNKIPATVRNSVWNTDIGIKNKQSVCFCCNTEQISFGNFECGHIQAEANEGKVTIQNLRPICSLCNKSMGKNNMETFMETFGFVKNENWNGIKKKIKNKNNKNNNIKSKYQCFTCKRNFVQKCHLDSHLNKKTKCQPDIIDTLTILQTPLPLPLDINPIIIKNVSPDIPLTLENNIKCDHCNKSFARKNSLYRHTINSCKILKLQNRENQDMIGKLLLLETKNKQLEEEIKNRDNKDILDKLLLLESKNKQLEKDIKNKDNQYIIDKLLLLEYKNKRLE
jgi:hypothetical protein